MYNRGLTVGTDGSVSQVTIDVVVLELLTTRQPGTQVRPEPPDLQILARDAPDSTRYSVIHALGPDRRVAIARRHGERRRFPTGDPLSQLSRCPRARRRPGG